MEPRNPFSRLKKRVKDRLAGRKTDPDKAGDGVGGTRLGPPESHVVVDDGLSREGNMYSVGGSQVNLADRPLLPGDPGLAPADESRGPRAIADESKSDWKPTAAATAKLVLRGVKDAADVFGPLKSLAGSLCFILENCEVWRSSFNMDYADGCLRE